MMRYDVIVIGGGHAGCEAAAAAARLGASTLVATSFLARVGQMSCNPAIGGIAKGTVAREVDALGGIMGRATDRTTLHFRVLNRSKGPAVRAPRAQCDRGLYPREVRRELEKLPRLSFYQGTIDRLLLDDDRVAGVVCSDGTRFESGQVILTAGTFLRGAMHTGTKARVEGGRAGDPAVITLASQLLDMGFQPRRFKTGTPPRVDGRTVDFSRLEAQHGEAPRGRFSHWERSPGLPDLACWLTRAGADVVEVVGDRIDESAMYGGAIAGQGPRYCPSIEDKVLKFPDAGSHQVFLEPEGTETAEMYVNGLSTSLPAGVQRRFLSLVPGLERAVMTQAGYAIEYDCFSPLGLGSDLETKTVGGLYFAGQINGTTGYEEAAGQGIVAGINAGRAALGKDGWVPRRDEAFIGVMIDDLVTRGVEEPYRLFTSRAEFRLTLRQDNCLERLGPAAVRLGLLGDDEIRLLDQAMEDRRCVREWVDKAVVQPAEAAEYLRSRRSSPLREPTRLSHLVLRPEVSLSELAGVCLDGPGVDDFDAVASVEMDVKYAGYVERERRRAREFAKREATPLAPDLPYGSFSSLSREARDRLTEVRPRSLAQASRISGVSATDLQNLLVEVKKMAAAPAT